MTAAVIAVLSGCADTESAHPVSFSGKAEPSSAEEVLFRGEVSPMPAEEDAKVAEETADPASESPQTEGSKSDSDVLAGNRDLTIVMVGDILLHTPVEEAARDESGKYNYDFIFQNLKNEIAGADLAIVNEEVIIGGEELGISGYPAFNAPDEIGDALAGAGFDVVCHATNHVLDKGKKGLLHACEYWDRNHPEITVAGINDREEEYRDITILEKKGIRIAILNYTYGTNGIPVPSDMPWAVDLLDKDKVISDLQYAEAHADLTVVCPHWGTEYRLEPDKSQEKWAGIFREYGADLVLGTHPHVIEPVVLMEDETSGITNNHGNGDMLVYYSLGNFVNWTSGTGSGVANRMVGGMAEVTVGPDDKGEITVRDYGVRALVCHVQKGYGGVTVYPLSAYSETMASQNEIIGQDPAFSAEYCNNLCNNVWGTLWH